MMAELVIFWWMGMVRLSTLCNNVVKGSLKQFWYDVRGCIHVAKHVV